MEVVFKEPEIRFDSVPLGEVFLHKNIPYMKIFTFYKGGDEYNAISLTQGVLESFFADAQVKKVKCSLVIEQKEDK